MFYENSPKANLPCPKPTSIIVRKINVDIRWQGFIGSHHANIQVTKPRPNKKNRSKYNPTQSIQGPLSPTEQTCLGIDINWRKQCNRRTIHFFHLYFVSNDTLTIFKKAHCQIAEDHFESTCAPMIA